MIPLSSTGEIASFQDVDQFQPAKTQFACGFFACSIVKSMAPVGHAPTQTVAQMIAEAEQWYAQYDGNNSISNTDGMTLQQLYKLLAQIGLHFVPASLDIATLRAWLRLGYPILIAGLETSFFDMGLGDVVPYPWQPSGNHIIVLTGVTADGNFLVRDSANVTNLYNSTTLRPGPRKYDAAKMRLVSATVVVPPWLPVPPAGFDPAKEQFVPIIPAGWHDDGNTLTAPNGHKVVHGFREYVLKNPRIAQRGCCRAKSDLRSERGSKPDTQPARDSRNRRTERKKGGREQEWRTRQEKRRGGSTRRSKLLREEGTDQLSRRA